MEIKCFKSHWNLSKHRKYSRNRAAGRRHEFVWILLQTQDYWSDVSPHNLTHSFEMSDLQIQQRKMVLSSIGFCFCTPKNDCFKLTQEKETPITNNDHKYNQRATSNSIQLFYNSANTELRRNKWKKQARY